MTDLTKRSIFKTVALSAVAAAAALTLLGCGKKEEAPKAEAPAAIIEIDPSSCHCARLYDGRP